MANQTKVALAPVISVADNELLTVQNSLCEASFIVHFAVACSSEPWREVMGSSYPR